METELTQLQTIDIVSKNKDGSTKEHIRIHPDGTEEIIWQQ